jgi:hypothetical protein
LVGTATAFSRYLPADTALFLVLSASRGSQISKTEVELRKSG